jgi:D-aspartate ligase
MLAGKLDVIGRMAPATAPGNGSVGPGLGWPRPVILAPFNGGLAVARALARRGEAVAVLAGGTDFFTSRTRGVEGEVLPGLPEGRGAWLERLQAQGNCAVVTGSDVASEFLVDERTALPEGVRTFEAADDAHLALMSKPRSYEIADEAGVRRPQSHFVATQAELDAAVAEARYPCIMKPALSHVWRSLFGDDRVFLAHSAEELAADGARALEAGLEIIVSDYIPGGDDAVEEAILVRAKDGTYPVAFGCRKIRQHPKGFGAASLCVTAPIPESMQLARDLLDQAGFVGVAGIETKRHAVTGEYYFLEANVRIPTQWGLGDAAGADVSWRLYATLAGVPLGPQPQIRHGVKLVFPELELRAALRGLRSRNSGDPKLLERLRSWRGARDLGILDRRDLGPALALVGRFARSRLSARVRRLRRRA